ncbi:MAG: transporter substrate-binding domain-containing protein [Pseudomonas veronii]|nr:transporter substrate-binding domain-containing protein [Pseudomonas veronii]
MRLIQDRLGVRIKLIEPVNWSAVLEQARNNQLDLLPGIMSTPERQAYMAFTAALPGLPHRHPRP